MIGMSEKLASAQLYPIQYCPAYISLGQVYLACSVQVRFAQISSAQISLEQVRSAQVSPAQIRPTQVSPSEASPGEISPGEIDWHIRVFLPVYSPGIAPITVACRLE